MCSTYDHNTEHIIYAFAPMAADPANGGIRASAVS